MSTEPPVEPELTEQEVVVEGEPVEAPPSEVVDDRDPIAVERDDYLDALQRLKAEFDNYRKRSERDRVAQARAGARDLIVELLPVLDNLDRAMAAAEGRDEGVVAGLGIVRGQLASVLSARGVSEVEAVEGGAFDPTLHDAVVGVPSADHEEGTLVAVTEKGYHLNETVLRPAKVAVAQAPPS